jgi:hypothetical protein
LDLGAASAEDLDGIADETLAQAIVDGGYGTQRISSHIMVNGTWSGMLPLSSSFAFFGQRYAVDSHVFSNLVYDRVGHGEILRVVPNPLDVAFAALGNDFALSLLEQELQRYPYAGDLAAVRAMVDAHPEDYWNSGLYTHGPKWLARVLRRPRFLGWSPSWHRERIARTVRSRGHGS